MMTAWTPNLKIVQMLVEHGADIHAKDKEGQTVLMAASAAGDPAIVKWLLEHGAIADLHAKDDMGYTAVNEAERYANHEVNSVLADAQARE